MPPMIKTFALAGAAAALIAASALKIDNSTRPASDIARDAMRKPTAMMAFAKIKRGQTVVDMLPGGGYFTRIIAQTVGSDGKVVALVADQYAKAFPKARTDIEALVAEPGYKNVTAAIRPLTDVGAPGSVDHVFTAQNYHDLKSKNLPAATADAVNRAVFSALKPGGSYTIIDHSAAAGSGLRDVDTLHRIDAAAVKTEVISAGFKFAGASTLLANKADDRARIVFNPAIQGKTDQFVFRFVKPKK